MPLDTGVQMDPIAGIAIKGDSTFALLLEAQRRGHHIFYYTPQDLFLRDGGVYATGHALRVADVEGGHFELRERETRRLDSLDVVLLRQDPPFDMAYLTTTYLLERIHPATLVVNDPVQVRNAPEKLLVTRFPELTPPTLITRSLPRLREFQAEFGDAIVKPLYGSGGAGVFHLRAQDPNTAALVELFRAAFREPFVVQRYLPEVREGDKRIILVDGEPAGALNRLPPPGETRSNMHAGGRPEPATLTPRDLEICGAIGPELKRLGLVFAGIDVIGAYLTEINVTSPTGIREVKRFGGRDIAALVWDAVENRLAERRVR